MFGNTDKPIEKIEYDTFGIGMYVEGLCRFIVDCDSPMTISIQGDWGSGKTSMMNMIKEKISDKVHPIWFNTWQFSQFQMQNELTVSMLCALLAELDYSQDKTKKIIGFLSGAAKTAAGILTEMVAGGVAADKVTGAFEGTNIDIAEEIKNLKTKFQEAVDEKLRKTKKDRVVIFVDDLDRLQPAKAVELLEVLKVFLDCEHCVYVLAVDYEVVTQGIKQKFGDMVGEQKGKSFFDKIIQLPFKMPVAQYDIGKYVTEQLSKMNINVDSDDVRDYVELIGLSIGCNPRSMKRLFNTYLLLDIILKNTYSANAGNDGRKLLFAIICMQMEFDELYEYIVGNRATLDGDMLSELVGDILSNDELKENLGVSEETQLLRISAYMKKFISVLQLDDDMQISEEEIDNLKEILSFSTVTSVGASGDSQAPTEVDKKYRYQNKDIVKMVNDTIKQHTGYELKVWQPRKNKGERKISDTWGYAELNSQRGISFGFEYLLKTDYSTQITTLKLSLYSRKPSTQDEFWTLFERSPISYAGLKAVDRYNYENIFSFHNDEVCSVADKISRYVCQAIAELDLYLKSQA